MTGIILAGGRNTRIGKEKALLRLEGGQPLIVRIIEILKPLFREMLLIANRREAYRDCGLPVVEDLVKRKGPLGGIFTGLTHSTSEYNFVMGCDMPFVEPRLIAYMMETAIGSDVVIPEIGGEVEPLFAVYSKSCIPVIFDHLSVDNLKTREILRKLRVRRVTEEEIDRFDPRRLSFFNLNTLEDQKRAEELFRTYRSP
jgi:molybdopterin-guanine dinucleotide biosynthesis protein A